MLGKSSGIVGEEEVGGGRYEYFTSIGGGGGADTAGVAGATSCVPNYCMYGRLDTELSGGMAPASPQAPSHSFGRKMIGNAISVDGLGSSGCIKDVYCRLK